MIRMCPVLSVCVMYTCMCGRVCACGGVYIGTREECLYNVHVICASVRVSHGPRILYSAIRTNTDTLAN